MFYLLRNLFTCRMRTVMRKLREFPAALARLRFPAVNSAMNICKRVRDFHHGLPVLKWPRFFSKNIHLVTSKEFAYGSQD